MHQKFWSAAVLALSLSLGSADAAMQSFGPRGSEFTIDVPANWQASRSLAGVWLSSPDERNAVGVSVGNTEGVSVGRIARLCAQAFHLGDVSGSDDLWTASGQVGDRAVELMIFALDAQRYVMVSIIAADREAAEAVFNTLDMPIPGAE